MAWKCPYCGSQQGMPYQDRNLVGMLCLEPTCGRMHAMTEAESQEEEEHFYTSDL